MSLTLSFLYWNKKGGYWLTSGRMGKYQAILLDNPNVTFPVTSALKPATTAPDCGCTVPRAQLPARRGAGVLWQTRLNRQRLAAAGTELFTVADVLGMWW